MDGAAEAFTFRPLEEGDVPFLHSSWGSSHYDGSPIHKLISPEEFHSFHRPLRERFLKRPAASVLLCVDTPEPWHILGWVAFEHIHSGPLLHYVYVKNAFKKRGIARELLRRTLTSQPVFYSHITDRAARIMAAKPREFAAFKYVPHLS